MRMTSRGKLIQRTKPNICVLTTDMVSLMEIRSATEVVRLSRNYKNKIVNKMKYPIKYVC